MRSEKDCTSVAVILAGRASTAVNETTLVIPTRVFTTPRASTTRLDLPAFVIIGSPVRVIAVVLIASLKAKH